MKHPFKVKPGTTIKLKDVDPAYTDGNIEKEEAKAEIKQNAEEMAELAYQLYAENKRSVLLVLQGRDTAGKDSTIKTVMKGVNPQSCQVTPFKEPSHLELDHDFLWRIHQAVPRKGNIGIFNRSHYEDVLIVRVLGLVPKEVWAPRYDHINDFEKLLSEGQTTLIKCFLHLSKKEQKERLQARLDNPRKHWKFSKADIGKRKYWDDYTKAYEAVLNRCSTPHAPWYIIPSDKKWFRNLTVSRILLQVLKDMNPRFPDPEPGLANLTIP